LELPFWLSRPCCRVRHWREAAEVAVTAVAVAVMAAEVMAAEAISVVVISVVVTAEVGAAASVACISAAATTPVRGRPFHIRFREEAFAAAILLRVAAEGTSARSETPRCDPEAFAVR
jgi:hypothetical protein